MQSDDPRTLPIEEKPKIQFITSNTFPFEVDMWFGSTVSARSVRLISQKTTERDTWWSELRHEITKNALSLNCTHIMGYREIVSIYEDVMVLNVFGTAVKISEVKYNRKEQHKHNTKMRQSPQLEINTVLNKVPSEQLPDFRTRSLLKNQSDSSQLVL